MKYNLKCRITTYLTPLIEKKLQAEHNKIEKWFGKSIRPMFGSPMRYFKRLVKLGIPSEQLRALRILIEETVIPQQNEHIKSRCEKAIYPETNRMTRCGLLTSYVHPCYICDLDYAKMSKRLKKAPQEYIEEIMRGVVLTNEYIDV